MEKSVTSGLKTTFLIHFVVAFLVGLQHLIVPSWWGTIAGTKIMEPAVYRILGAALLGFAASSWLAYRETAWARVRIIVIMEIVWSALAALATVWGIFFEGLPPLEWLNVVILGGFTVVFVVFFLKMRPSR